MKAYISKDEVIYLYLKEDRRFGLLTFSEQKAAIAMIADQMSEIDIGKIETEFNVAFNHIMKSNSDNAKVIAIAKS